MGKAVAAPGSTHGRLRSEPLARAPVSGGE